MKVLKEQVLQSVNEVMAQMFYLLPDVDDLGQQVQKGDISGETESVSLEISEQQTLRFEYQTELIALMTSHLTALPTEEVPRDWIRQMPLEATEVCWAHYLNTHDKNSELLLGTPYRSEDASERSKTPQWKVTFQSENYRLRIALLEFSSNVPDRK